MNYSNFVVKLIEISKQSFFEDNTSVIEILVKFPQIRANNQASTFRILVWGELVYDIVKYYHVNDYVIIEGYISFKNLVSNSLNVDKQVEISVFKIYPFVMDNIYLKKIDK
jgi:single-stranded DNA-binding protein